MHTLHYIAVEAQDIEEAFSDVQTFLEASEDTGYRVCDWSDWHVVGGGRWNNEGDGYTDNANMIISYAEKPEEFKKALEDISKFRIQEANNYLAKIKLDKFTSDIVDYISNNGELPDDNRFDLNNYYINTMCKLMTGEWIPDSAFYDKKEFTADMRYLRERLDKPETAMLQFLVPVDFHF
jgi:hypothetical protein